MTIISIARILRYTMDLDDVETDAVRPSRIWKAMVKGKLSVVGLMSDA